MKHCIWFLILFLVGCEKLISNDICGYDEFYNMVDEQMRGRFEVGVFCGERLGEKRCREIYDGVIND